MKCIGENIGKFRKDRNMMQEEFAMRLGVTPQAVSKWERGSSLPDIMLFADICRLLQVRSDELLGMEGMPICEYENMETEREIKLNLIAEPVRIDIGSGLIPCVEEGLKADYVNRCRKKMAAQTGILLPVIRIRDDVRLKENEVRILSYDQVLWQKEYPKADDRTYYDIIDETVRQCRENYGRIINKQLVKSMLDNLKEQYPGVLEGLVPERAGYYEVLVYLRRVIQEKGNIRDLIHIMEEMERELL